MIIDFLSTHMPKTNEFALPKLDIVEDKLYVQNIYEIKPMSGKNESKESRLVLIS